MEEEEKAALKDAENGESCGDSENLKNSEENAEEFLRYKNKKEVCKGGVLGAAIGLAIIVPGVSGSVVAIILSLYEKLLFALGNIFKRFKPCVKFLLPVLVGAVAGIIVGFFGVKALLSVLPFAVVALFAGLMLGAFPSVTDQLKGEKPTPYRICLFVVGFAVPIVFSVVSVFLTGGNLSLDELKVYHYILFILLGYAVSVTQLVPGLSGTALLMMCGCFTPFINSVSVSYWHTNLYVFLVYACLAVGFIAGLLTVSKGMSELLKKYRYPSFYMVAGLSLGSTVAMFFNPDIYAVYQSWSDGIPWVQVAVGIVLFFVGAAIAYLFVRYERKHAKP